MNLYYKLIYLFLNKEIYDKYKETIHLKSISSMYPAVYKLFISLFELQSRTNNSLNSVKDLETVFLSLYPNENVREWESVFARIEREGSESNKDLLVSYLNDARTRLQAFELAKVCIAVSDGDKPPAALLEGLEKVREDLAEGALAPEEEAFVTDDLETLYNKNVKERGLRWRLDSLNKAAGSLRKGDFVVVFARPETGKTTFLASETTYMASCLKDDEGPILWINNEEQGDKVMLRCYQAALNLTTPELARDIEANKIKFIELVKHKIKIIDKAHISKNEVESLTNKWQPSLIVIDQIDKVKGFNNDRKDLELGDIYIWARELAKQNCPVIGICQADGTGEGVKALTMSHVSNAKTSKQAEADLIVGIGKSHSKDEEFIRYFNISKNKLFGDDDTDPSRKHDFWEVEIDPQHARYKDFQMNDDYTNSR